MNFNKCTNHIQCNNNKTIIKNHEKKTHVHTKRAAFLRLDNDHEVEIGFLWLTFHMSSIKLTSLNEN